MLKNIRLRFEQQVTLAVGMLCLALLAASAAGALWISMAYEVDRIKQHSSGMATHMATELDTVMFERFREIQFIAGLEPLRGLWHAEPLAIRATLNRMQASLPAYAWIGFASIDGTVVAATQGMLEGSSVGKRDWFVAGLKGPAASDVHEALLLSSLLPQQSTEPARFVDVSMPIYDQHGTLVGVLGAHLKWTWIEAIRQRFLSSEPAASDVWILSSEGKVLLGPGLGSRPFEPERLAQMKTAGRGTFVDRSGAKSILTGYASTGGLETYQGLGWIVVARTPEDIAYAPVYQTVRTMLLFSSIVAAIGVLLAWIVARRSAAPIVRLTAAVHQIGRDPTITTLPWLGGASEFVELSSSLRSLLRRIGVVEQELVQTQHRLTDDTQRFKQAIDTLRIEADHDPLTGLLNRRAFLIAAEDALTYFRRYRRTIAILMVDIDHFKSVNDRFGHAAGDAVLGQVAEVLRLSVRKSDKVSRFGGEEFVLLLREISQDDLIAFAERLRVTVASLAIVSERTTIGVTISIGAALVSDGESDIQMLIERADKALYVAKRSGRDCVRAAPTPVHEGLREVA